VANIRTYIRPIEKIKVKKSQGFVVWFFVIVSLLAFSLVFLILNKTWDSIKEPLDTGLTSAMPDDPSVNVSEILDQTTSTNRAYDKLMPFLLIGLFAFVLITAGTIMDHPIMIVVGLIILGVVIFLAVIYANLYNEISATSEFASTKANLPIQDKFMEYLPFIIFIMAIGIGAAILWSKKGGGGGL
jgi:hypothetical protein